MQLTEDMIRHPLSDEAGRPRPFDIMQAAFREQELRLTRELLRQERRAKRTFAVLACCGWVLAIGLALQGGAL